MTSLASASQPPRPKDELGRRSNGNIQELTDSLQQMFDFERLVKEVIRSRGFQFLDSILFHHAGDAQNPDIVQIGVGPDDVTDVLSVNIRQHDVEDDQVWMVLFNHHSGPKAVVYGADFEPTIPFQNVADEFNELFIVIDDENLVFRVLQVINRNSVFPHESDQLIAGNTTESASRNAKSFQLARVEAANDRLLTDLTDLGRFTGREDGLTREW